MADNYHDAGLEIIRNGDHRHTLLPFQPWTDFNLRHTLEYPVVDFPTEVGFHATVLGHPFAVLSDDYAICRDPEWAYTYAFKKFPGDDQPDLSFLRLQFYTDGLDQVKDAVEARGITPEVKFQSANQRFLCFTSPAGMPIEIWGGWEDEPTSTAE